jgi:hypothetical protein
MAVADFTTTRFRRSIAFNTCDSIHDFLKGPRCEPSPKGKLIDELKKKFTEFTKAGLLDQVEAEEMYKRLTFSHTMTHPETSIKDFLISIPYVKTHTVYVTNNDNALKFLSSLFGYFGHASITDDNNPVKIVMDGGSGGLGALSKVLNTKVSIVNVVTPATACDSAVLSTKDLFGNPILFESPFPAGTDNKPPEFSDAAFFSGSKIAPQSEVYDSNIKPSCRIYVDDTYIYLPSYLRGPPVPELCNGINNPAYDGPWKLSRFTTAQKFDLKRCGDSDQIRYCKKLGYIFVTIDEICAYIAAYFYEVPTILQTHGLKGAKYFRLFKPNQGLAAMVGGSKTDSSFVIQPTSMQQVGGNEDYEVPTDETEIFSTICGLASSTLLNGLSSSPAFKPLAAACSAFNLLQKTGMLQRSYVLQHNAIYPPPYNVHAGTTIDIVKTWLDQRFQIQPPPAPPEPLSKNVIITQLPPSEFASFIEELKMKGIYPPPAGGLPSLLATTYEFIEKYPNKNVVLLTLALVDAYITNPLSPQLSAIHTIIFHDILIPRNPNIKPLQNIPGDDHVSAEISAIYSQLIDVFSTFIGDPTKTFSIGPGAMKLVAGGKRKKTHRNKLKRKRTKRNKNSKK